MQSDFEHVPQQLLPSLSDPVCFDSSSQPFVGDLVALPRDSQAQSLCSEIEVRKLIEKLMTSAFSYYSYSNDIVMTV